MGQTRLGGSFVIRVLQFILQWIDLQLEGRRRGFQLSFSVSSSITNQRVILCQHSFSLLFQLSFYYCNLMNMAQSSYIISPLTFTLFRTLFKLEYTNNKRSSKPSLPYILEPTKLLLLTDLTKPCPLQLSGSRNTLDCIRQTLQASFGKSPKLPKLQNTLYTLKMCRLCLGTDLLSRYNNGRGKEKRLE